MMVAKRFFSLIMPCLIWIPVPAGALEADPPGSLSGQVVDVATGLPVAGASVSLKELETDPVRTDLNGRYLLRDVPEGTYTLVVFKAGYRFSEIRDLRIEAAAMGTANVPLEPRSAEPETAAGDVFELAAFVVEAEAAASSESVLLFQRRRSVTVTDAIGEDRFGTLGISDAAQALAKTVGTTIVDGKYAVIRGLGDRYTNTRLNGLSVPSAEPDRLAVQLDQFPADLLESVVTSKTFTADQPGAFSGGSINMVTKSFPVTAFTKLGISLEFNTQATGENVLSIPGGGRDWTARDDGSRALSPDAPNPLVNATASAARIKARRGDFSVADQLDRNVSYFNNRPFYPVTAKGDPNFGWSLSAGDRWDYGQEAVLGYVAALTYDRKVSHYQDGTVGRYSQGSVDPDNARFVDLARVFSPDPSIYNFYPLYQANPLTPLGEPPFGVTRTSHTVDWGAFAQLSWKPTGLTELSLRYFHNQSADDTVKRGAGEAVRSDSGSEFRENYDLLYTERAVNSLQFSGETLFRRLEDAKLEWRASTSKSTQDQPDYRNFEFKWNFLTGEYDPSGITNNRYFRELAEDNVELAVDFSLPVDIPGDGRITFKTGLFHSDSERTNRERSFSIEGFILNGDTIPSFPQPVGILNRTENSVQVGTYMREVSSSSDYDGSRTIEAAYLMADWQISYALRAVAGARLERTDMTTEPLPVGNLPVKQGLIEEEDVLPHASLIYSINDDMNLRFAYGDTIARPTFRELADIRINEPFTGDVIAGNPDLRMTSIRNYDLRWEFFPHENEVLAVSLFHKDLTDAIELTFDSGRIFPQNAEEGRIQGIELEYRQHLGRWHSRLDHFTLGLNFSYIESEVSISDAEFAAIVASDPEASRKREFFGQSPYIVNLDLTYENPEWGTALTAVFNVSGERLDLVTTGALPDVYEQPFESLDLIYSQKLPGGWGLKLAAKNLLDPEKEKTLEHQGQTFLYESYTRGRFFSIGLSYTFN